MVKREKHPHSQVWLLVLMFVVGCTYEPPTANTSGAGGGAAGAGGDTGGTSVGGSGGGGQGHEMDCLDGQDNDSDGQIDCGDLDCDPGYECVPAAPSGSGPYVRILLTTGEAKPAVCPVDGSTATIRGVAPVDPMCSACGCQVSDVDCRVEVISTFTGADCTGVEVVQEANSECVSLQPPLATGSIRITRGKGSLTVLTTPAQPAPSVPWKDVAQVCPAYGASTGGGCMTNQFCVPRAKVPFESYICVNTAGDLSCNGEYGRKLITYDSAQDSRGCTGCGCDAEAQCSGYSATLDSGATCNDGGGPSIGFDTCAPVTMDTRTVKLGTLTWQVTKKVLSGGDPMGSVTPTNQRTFCCTQ